MVKGFRTMFRVQHRSHHPQAFRVRVYGFRVLLHKTPKTSTLYVCMMPVFVRLLWGAAKYILLPETLIIILMLQ